MIEDIRFRKNRQTGLTSVVNVSQSSFTKQSILLVAYVNLMVLLNSDCTIVLHLEVLFLRLKDRFETVFKLNWILHFEKLSILAT